MFKSIEKEKMGVIQESKLERLLDNLNILDEVLSGLKKCKFCNESVKLNEIFSIFPESGDIKIVCSKVNCMKDFIRYRDDKKYDN